MTSNTPYPDPAFFGSDPKQGLNATSRDGPAGFGSSRPSMPAQQFPGSSVPAVEGFGASVQPQNAFPQPSTASKSGPFQQRMPELPHFYVPPTNGPSFPPQKVGSIVNSHTSYGQHPPPPGPVPIGQTGLSSTPSVPSTQGQLASRPNQVSVIPHQPPMQPASRPTGSFVSPVPPPFQPSGSFGTPNQPMNLSGIPISASNSTLNQSNGSFPPPNPALNQQGGPFPPPNPALNQQSGSFPSPNVAPYASVNQPVTISNATSQTPQLGPPTFGLPQPGAYPPSAPGNQRFPDQEGVPGMPQVPHSYIPGAVSQAPTFRSDLQNTQNASQHLQFVGHMQSYGSPVQTLQGLLEDFKSLSMTTLPGSMEVSVDPNSLPRPSPEDSAYPKQTSVPNCDGKFMCLTTGSLPNSQSLASKWSLPLGAVIHPLAETSENDEVPIIDFGSSGIIRCRRCRTYINPFVVFVDNGRRWRCNLCDLNNEVPAEYYCPVDQHGKRTDTDERPELCQGSVEFLAPAEYMVRPPMPPVYFFLIDVSFSAVKTGMLQIAADTIRSCLDKLARYPRTQIGFMTFDNTLHFYNLKSSLTQPHMMVVADVDDPFLPSPDDLLVNLLESRAVIETLLNSLPTMFTENQSVESALGPSLRGAYNIMSQLGGKLLVFQSTLPSLGAGRLKVRGDDPRIYGSDKESTLRNPDDPFYKQMAAEFSKFQISVNIYGFVDKYIDLASLGILAKYTGGQVYFYPSFKPHLDAEKFRYELTRDLTRETAWEAVLRVRCGKGLKFNSYHGHFFLRSSDLMALPAVDCDKAFAMKLTLEESLVSSSTAHFQAALLYTSSNGERRIRIHTLAVPVTSNLNDMYRTANVGAIVALMSKLAIEKSLTTKLEDVRQQMVQAKVGKALRDYQNIHGAQQNVKGRLIYPDSLKLLPLYCLGLYKCLALRSGNTSNTLDESMSACFDIMTMPISCLLSAFYPTMFRLDEYLLKGGEYPKSVQSLPLSAQYLDPSGAFLLNDGLRFVIWFGGSAPAEFVISLLGSEAGNQANPNQVAVTEQGNELSARFLNLLKSLRLQNPSLYQKCFIVRQGDHIREGSLMLQNLVEDRTVGSTSYTDWVNQIYRQVLQKK